MAMDLVPNIFHDILVNVRRQDSSYQKARLGKSHHTSVETNNSLFEYSNNRRPNNDIRIRIRSFLKYWIIFEYSNNKLRITNNQFQYFNFEFNPFLYGNWMKNWVNVCRYQFISNSHIVIQEILYLMVRESWDIWVLRF